MFVNDGNGITRADVLAGMHQAAAACGGDQHSVNRAFVAGDVDHRDGIGIGPVAAHRHPHPFFGDGPLLVDTALHAVLVPGCDFLGNPDPGRLQIAGKGVPDHFFENSVFDKLYVGIEYLVADAHIYMMD